MQQTKHLRTTPLILLACVLYFGFACFYNAYTMISVDEFWYAHRIYQYRSGLPYRDFSPYKTVLGYYVLLLPMLLTHGYFQTLITLKNTVTLINTLAFASGSILLARRFHPTAALCALLLVLFSETVLSYGAQIRVDILGYWCAFFALLALLDKKPLLAALLMGAGFLITQKIIWYWFASDVGLGLTWLLFQRNTSRFFAIVYYNAVILAIIAVYIAVWSQISSFKIVWDSLFVEAGVMYHLAWYAKYRELFWHFILNLNPYLFLVAPFTLVSLLTLKDKEAENRVFIVSVAVTILLCLVPYQQVFPYYMQVTIPAFLLLYTSFFSWVQLLCHRTVPVNAVLFLTLLSAMTVLSGGLIIYFKLPYPYLLLLLTPVCLLLLVRTKQLQVKQFAVRLLVLVAVFVGGVYPLALFLNNMFVLNGNYQKANLNLALRLFEPGDDYLAGVELFYGRNQPIAGMRHLIGPAITYLAHPTPALRDAMTASQYEDPNATETSVIGAIPRSNIAFYINNYRLEALPSAIKAVLDKQYRHAWGSIYTYAPLIAPNDKTFYLAFSARYEVLTTTGSVTIDHKTIATHKIITLPAGEHTNQTNTAFRVARMFSGLPPTPIPDNSARLLF